MKLNRRQFLAATLVGAGSAILVRPAWAADAKEAPVNPYELVPLGKTGLRVSRIGFGTGMRGSGRQSNQTRLGAEKFEALLKDFYDRGGRMFDMADLYGSMPFVGRAMKANRDKCVFLSKIWVGHGGIPELERPDADVVVDRFRKELDSDYIDIILLHCQTSATWTDEQKKQMDILENLKAKKIIRAHGVSIHSLDALKLAAKEPWVDSVNARINHAGMNMDGPVEQVAPVLKALHEAGKGVVGMKLIGEGKWRDDPDNRDKAIRYVLGLGTVDTMVVGFEKSTEVDDFEKRVAAAMKEKAPALAMA
jgi:aryl-alcohol dehydrogenase-like predicted oxidoreductase